MSPQRTKDHGVIMQTVFNLGFNKVIGRVGHINQDRYVEESDRTTVVYENPETKETVTVISKPYSQPEGGSPRAMVIFQDSLTERIDGKIIEILKERTKK